MLTLALDTTTRAGSVALLRDATVLAIVEGDPTRTHGERLPAEIERALHDGQVVTSDVELLAVASGPGAFTGLRIGLAAMQGLAMVLNIPVIAVSALDALALAAIEGSATGARDASPGVAAWMDAQRGEVFAAYYSMGNDQNMPAPVSTPVVGIPERVLAGLLQDPAVFIGDGAIRYRAQILQHMGARHLVIEPPRALAPFIATLGMRLAARGHAGPPHALQPLYVRRSDAELERQRRETR